MSGVRIRYTKEIQETFALLKSRFAESGCFIFTARRSVYWPRSTVIAVPKLKPTESVLMRATSRGVITVVPLSTFGSVERVRAWSRNTQTPCAVCWIGRSLVRLSKFSAWHDFMAESDFEVWAQLTQGFSIAS